MLRITTSRIAAFSIVVIIIIINIVSPLSLFLPDRAGAAQFNLQNHGSRFKAAATSKNFTRVAHEVIPTVVSINSIMMIYASELWKDQFDEKELQELFSEKYFNFQIPKEFRQKGSGSGIIVSKEGYILTNMHVVEKAEIINVILADNRSYRANLVGADPLTELAVIKIEGNHLPVARLGNSDSLQIGEWVLAIGNPLELRSTVTAGIISAIGRDINIIADNYGVENFIQTDATINPGNSGGALVNLKGEIIGINTAIATQSGFNQGYGFAIPINIAKEVMKDLIQRGYVIRSYLGISMQDVNEKIARALRLKHPSGVFVDHVAGDSPARVYGLRDKDVIIKIDGDIVNKGNIVQSIIARKKPGDEIVLTIIRRNRLLRIPVILGERRGTKVRLVRKNDERKFKNLGLEVESITRRVAEDFGLKMGEGVLVAGVEQFSPAFDAGIQVNDVILEIDDRIITSDYSFEKVISGLRYNRVYIFKMKRDENIFHIFIEVAK